MQRILNAIWKWIVFKVGDTRFVKHIPFMVIGRHHYKVSYDEAIAAWCQFERGDIGLHRDAGFLSNTAIPGFMKHGSVVVEGDHGAKIVEAVSEGVLERSIIYLLHTDYAAILRPKCATPLQKDGAVEKARQIVGKKYDVGFEFDIEKEHQYYRGKDRTQAELELRAEAKGLQRYDPAFSCTEVMAYAWWHLREQLRIYRKHRRGKDIILADDFFNHSWEIVWLSKSVTAEAAKRLGLHEEGVAMVTDYWKQVNGEDTDGA